MQTEHAGTVSRISLIINRASDFLPSSDALPSPQLIAAPIAPNNMLTHLDRLCEALDNTLREVVIALFPNDSDDFDELQADPIGTISRLRDQMPSLARRQRLVFRVSRKSWQEDDFEDSIYETACRHVFICGSPHWRDVTLDKTESGMS